MAPIAFDLLRALGSGVRALGAGLSGSSNAAPNAASVDGGQFAELLSKARNGQLVSNKPVLIAADAKATVKLSDDQLARISLAADKAEADGIRTALVVIDDQQVVLDVANRTITRAAGLGEGNVLSGVDGVINLSSKLGSPDDKPATVPLPAGWNSESLTRLIASAAAGK